MKQHSRARKQSTPGAPRSPIIVDANNAVRLPAPAHRSACRALPMPSSKRAGCRARVEDGSNKSSESDRPGWGSGGSLSRPEARRNSRDGVLVIQSLFIPARSADCCPARGGSGLRSHPPAVDRIGGRPQLMPLSSGEKLGEGRGCHCRRTLVRYRFSRSDGTTATKPGTLTAEDVRRA